MKNAKCRLTEMKTQFFENRALANHLPDAKNSDLSWFVDSILIMQFLAGQDWQLLEL
jgi:hypothetical protein